ncbi:MAG: hypothetical protein RRY29_04185 [Desulfovibrionaceae bacterium]
MESNIISPPDPYETVLGDIGRRRAAGVKLSMVEENMAMVATGVVSTKQYGPSIREAEPLNIDTLPENVKGVLASYAV